MSKKYTHRVKYWVNYSDGDGGWERTGLMSKKDAEKTRKHLRESHFIVRVYRDGYEGGAN